VLIQDPGDTSRTLGNATAPPTAEMGKMKIHLSVAVGKITSRVPMGNASGTLGNATEAVQTAKMGAMSPQRHVAQTVGE